jgi:adenylosuccinate lyase
MYTLAGALESFNRKERNLLVRKILGQAGSPSLSKRFSDQVAQKLGLQSIPDKAWWATDYHISWLAGALALSGKG